MSTLSLSNLKTNSYPAVGVDRKRPNDFDLNFSGKLARIPSMENCGYEMPSGSFAATENPFSRLEELERFAMIESLADRANCNLDSRTDTSSPTSSLENNLQRIPDRKKYIPAENISRIESDDTVDAGDAIGRWTKTEHEQFLKGLRTVGKNWRQIAGNFVRTRTEQQIRTHAAAYFEKMSKMPCMGGKQAAIAPRSNARTVSMGSNGSAEAAPVAVSVAPPAPTLVRSQTLEAAQTLQGFSYFAPVGASGAPTTAGLVPVSTPGGLEVVQPLTLPSNPAAASGLLFPSAAAVEHYNQYMLTIAAQYYQMAALYQPPAGMAPTPAAAAAGAGAGEVPSVSAYPSPTLAGLPAPANPAGLTALPLRPSISSVIASAVSVAVNQYLPQIQAGVSASAKQLQFPTEAQQQLLTAANLPAAYTAGEPVLMASASYDEADQQAPQSPVSLPSELQAREADAAAVLAEASRPAAPVVVAAAAAALAGPATLYTPPEPKRVRTPEEIEAHKAAQRAKHLETLRLEAEKRQRQKEKEDFKEAQRQLKLQMQAQNKLQKAAAAAYRAGVEPSSVVAALPNLSGLGAAPHTNQLQVAEILSNLARN